MTAFIDAIGGWVIDHNTLRYLFVVGSIILQGEIGTFISVTLILKNYLSWGGFFAAALGGIVLYDGFLFSIGKALKNKPLGEKWEKKIIENKRISRYLQNNMNHLLIVSRFLMYINVGAVVLAGLTNMKLKDFLKNRIFADTLWILALTVGSYLILSGLILLNLQQIEIGIAIFLVIAFAGHALFRKSLSRKNGLSSRPL